MVDMAKAAISRTELQAEILQRLFVDVEMSLQSVSSSPTLHCLNHPVLLLWPRLYLILDIR